jgi:hypothetical protein
MLRDSGMPGGNVDFVRLSLTAYRTVCLLWGRGEGFLNAEQMGRINALIARVRSKYLLTDSFYDCIGLPGHADFKLFKFSTTNVSVLIIFYRLLKLLIGSCELEVIIFLYRFVNLNITGDRFFLCVCIHFLVRMPSFSYVLYYKLASKIFIYCILYDNCCLSQWKSSLGRNAYFCCTRFNSTLDNITNVNRNTINQCADEQLSTDDYFRVSLIRELLQVRSGALVVTPGLQFSGSDITDMIDSLAHR